ncbi:MaoC family dehydratase [Marinomonas sp. 2405UD68-3]|uniref:MaoC family dehydratase n=1 Tax=Marinomonas sp. 2405UD68-3 TaxID=3391835 RepID=UPI0039C8ED2E
MTAKLDINTFSIDQTSEVESTVTKENVQLFAQVTGDTNPVHLDEEYAASTSFKKPIAHGMLTAGFISAVIGTALPGPGCIYLEQSLKFRAPVYIGDTVMTRVTITDINTRRKRLTIKTECIVDSKVVVNGEAIIMIPA